MPVRFYSFKNKVTGPEHRKQKFRKKTIDFLYIKYGNWKNKTINRLISVLFLYR